jgi:hypothetical protein
MLRFAASAGSLPKKQASEVNACSTKKFFIAAPLELGGFLFQSVAELALAFVR